MSQMFGNLKECLEKLLIEVNLYFLKNKSKYNNQKYNRN